jgi:hypothetical protein
MLVCSAAVVVMLQHLAWGGGSFGYEETLQPVLQKDAKLGHLLLDTFEFADAGGGVRLGHQWEHLSAYRIGPYEIRARRKDRKDKQWYQLKIDTNQSFIRDGKKLPESRMFEATTVTETIAGVTITLDDTAVGESN